MKFKKYYYLFEDLSSGLFMFTGFLLMFYEVVMRYVFHSPTTWINETSTILVVWGVLLGLSLGLRDNHHISVDILYEIMPSSVRKAIDYFANLMGVLFCMFFTYNGIVLVQHGIKSGQISVETGIPMWVYYLVIPISGLLFTIRFITKILQIQNKNRNPVEQEVESIEHRPAL